MLVREYMTPNPMSVNEDSSILEAAELMKKYKVRRFPVLRDEALIGIVTDRDLRSAAPSQVISFDAQERELMPELHSLLSGITVKEVMSRKVITIRPEQTIVAAAQLMLQHRMSGLSRHLPRAGSPALTGPLARFQLRRGAGRRDRTGFMGFEPTTTE